MNWIDRAAVAWLTRRWQSETIPSEDHLNRVAVPGRRVILGPGVVGPPGVVISFEDSDEPLRPQIITASALDEFIGGSDSGDPGWAARAEGFRRRHD